MKYAALANLTMCACPLIVAATAVTTIPTARAAVHRVTSNKPHHKPAATKHAAAAKPPCAPLQGGAFSSFPDLNDVLATEETPFSGDLGSFTQMSARRGMVDGGLASGFAGPAYSPVNGGNAGGGGGTDGGTQPAFPAPTEPPVSTVPELGVWVMLVVGFGAVGFMARRAKWAKTAGNRPKRSKLALGAASLFVEGNLVVDGASAALHPQAAIATAGGVKSAILAKAALCVCSAAVLTAAVTTVPPIRRAVASATAPTLRHIAPPAPCITAVASASD